MSCKAAFITDGGRRAIEQAYSLQTRRELAELAEFPPEVLERPEGSDAEYLFSTWGMPVMTEQEAEICFPRLRAVFYAAGSVQAFARPLLNRGIRVFSAWAANAIPVAEYTAAQILLAGKGFFQASRLYSGDGWEAARRHAESQQGSYGASVGIIGAGMIGREVIRRLKGCRLKVLVFDPFLPDERAAELGVEKCGLHEVFARCRVISNHLANNPQTVGMLDYGCFSRMQPAATFLNTGRGAQVVEADLIRALREEPSRTAVLDVTWPEPVGADSPLRAMGNVVLTPHIAGSMGDEIARMGDYMLDEFRRLLRSEAPQWEVTPAMLQTMA